MECQTVAAWTRDACCSYDSKMQSIMATVASHKKLFTYYQRNGINSHQYFQEFTPHYGTLETYGGNGAIGITPVFLTAKLQELALNEMNSSATNPTDAEQKMAILLVWDKFLGCLMLSGANRDRYANLKSELHNQYGFGKDLYPKPPNQCLNLLNHHSDAPISAPPHQQTPRPVEVKQEDEALVFAQGLSDRKGPSKSNDNGLKTSLSSASSSYKSWITNVCCKLCGKIGHSSS
jgi:hypothetical protein